VDRDGNDEIILPTEIVNVDKGTVYPLGTTSSVLYWPGAVMTTDINGDGQIEVCSANKGYGFCAYPLGIDVPPVLTDSYGRGWDNPICQNTNLRFSAKEYDATAAQSSGTNYYDDMDSQQEKLIADCYGNGTLTNGSLNLNAPYIDCVYNNTGTYYAKVYLQDSYNLGDYTQYDDITVLVVSGSPGITCNVEAASIGEESVNGTAVTGTAVNPSTEGVENFLDYLTGGSTKAKIFIGFMIWLLIVVAVGGGMAAITHNGMAVGVICALAGFVGFIVLTAVGIFPVWILIILMLGLALLAVLKIGFTQAGG
jgi:hypothetical protein